VRETALLGTVEDQLAEKGASYSPVELYMLRALVPEAAATLRMGLGWASEA
jgi:hypothetical protein